MARRRSNRQRWLRSHEARAGLRLVESAGYSRRFERRACERHGWYRRRSCSARGSVRRQERRRRRRRRSRPRVPISRGRPRCPPRTAGWCEPNLVEQYAALPLGNVRDVAAEDVEDVRAERHDGSCDSAHQIADVVLPCARFRDPVARSLRREVARRSFQEAQSLACRSRALPYRSCADFSSSSTKVKVLSRSVPMQSVPWF